MRQQNNNNNNNNNKNRMRGRGRGKPQNTANRNFESNGPDVKIRGNAAHIAEKYQTLARDALSSGDRVVAENYLQHAEHYNRIVAAANALREEAQAAQNQNRNNQQDDDDQPNVNAGNAANGSSNDDDNDANANSGDDNNRRPRRRDAQGVGRTNGRQPRKADADSETSSNDNRNDVDTGDSGTDSNDEPAKAAKPKTRRTTRKKEEASDGISQDAAGLPQGLLGGSPE